MKLTLSNITLIGIDCTDLKRLQLAAEISTKDITFGAVKLLSSIPSDDKRVIKISPIRSKKEYSNFIVKELDKYVDTEFALVFQYDGFILNPDAWNSEFLKYDYIGAPWYHIGNLRVGNGGFSLRSKRLINWLANNWKKVKTQIHPEDVFISKFARPYLEKDGMVFAPENIASKFSIEGNYKSVVWNNEFGFHGITYTDISKWLDLHPEYKNQLHYEVDDYVKLMKKYPFYNGTVHTLKFKKFDIKNYRQISENKKKYEARATINNYIDISNIKPGHILVFKRSGVSFDDLPIPAFEKQVKKVEIFQSFGQLRSLYPNIYVTYPMDNIKKWERPLVKFFGDMAYPKDISYTVLHF